jgi:hypothetical protein
VDFSVVYRTVACFGGDADAEIVRAQLAAEGIPAAIRGESDPELRLEGEVVRVLVPASDLDRARALLAPTDPTAARLEVEHAAAFGASPRVWAAAWAVASSVLGLALALSLACLALSLR